MSERGRPAPWVARILFVGACVAVVAIWFPRMPSRVALASVAVLAAFGLAFEQVARRIRAERVAGSLVGLFVGAGAGAALLVLVPGAGPARPIGPALVVVLAFLGATAGGRAAEAFGRRDAPGDGSGRPAIKVVDTSALVDGRLADVAASGFLEGTLVVPGFVLNELQHVADSSDPSTRARGRRGLDTLAELRNGDRVPVDVRDVAEPAGAREASVDERLVRLASSLGAALVTTDHNLEKVAGIRGVAVLNLHGLARALRSAALPGDRRRLPLRREGREAGQGVGHLEDGTMVVVEGGREHVGTEIEVEITSVLQTPGGPMLFARPTAAGGDDQNG